MSGVIDQFGQWEHCGDCREFVLFLPRSGGNGKLWTLHDDDGQVCRDLCHACACKHVKLGHRVQSPGGQFVQIKRIA